MEQEFSPSSVNTYLQCGYKFGLQYGYVTGERIRTPPSGFIQRGKAVHEGIKYNYQQKIESHKDLPLGDVVMVAAEKFSDLMKEEEVITDIDEPSVGKLLDTTAKLAEVYQKVVSPHIQPERIEVKLEMDIKDPFGGEPIHFIGFPDVETATAIHDTKTKNGLVKKTPQITPGYQRQLTAYQILREQEGKTVETLTNDFTYLTTSETPTILPVTIPARNEEQKKNYLDTVAEVAKGVRAGVFVPNTDGFLCSQRYCSYWGKYCSYGPRAHS